MIVMVSTNTCMARDPDHSDSTNPSEITSKRPPSSTSSIVGSMILLTADGVSARDARSMTAFWTSFTWAAENESET
jgi:hypothetical protein